MSKADNKELEEAVKILENKECFWNNSEIKVLEAIETVLSMLKEKDALYHKVLSELVKADKKNIEKDKEIEKKDKIIEQLAFSLADYVMYYDYDKCKNPEIIKAKAKENIEYFEKKVKKR